VARAMAAVLVAQSFADRDVHEAKLWIRGVRRPRVVLADAWGARLRAILPRLGPELTRLRNQIEVPELFAGVHVETPDVSGNVAQVQRVVAVHRRVADDDDIADDDRG